MLVLLFMIEGEHFIWVANLLAFGLMKAFI
jgi:hypothetical protein